MKMSDTCEVSDICLLGDYPAQHRFVTSTSPVPA